MSSLLTISRKKYLAKRYSKTWDVTRKSASFKAKKNWMSQVIGKEPVEKIYLIYSNIV